MKKPPFSSSENGGFQQRKRRVRFVNTQTYTNTPSTFQHLQVKAGGALEDFQAKRGEYGQ